MVRLPGLTDRPAGFTDRLAGLTDWLAGLTDRPAGLTDWLARLTDRLAGLADRPAGVTERLAGLTDKLLSLGLGRQGPPPPRGCGQRSPEVSGGGRGVAGSHYRGGGEEVQGEVHWSREVRGRRVPTLGRRGLVSLGGREGSLYN